MKPYSQHQIEELLNKFMEGNTTIEEESLLSEYFSTTPHIPSEWADYKAMFGYLDWRELCFPNPHLPRIANGFGGLPFPRQRQLWRLFSVSKL